MGRTGTGAPSRLVAQVGALGRMAIVTLVIGAVLSAALGHHIRRSEHLRERRVDAFSSVLRTFLEVQTTARDLWKWSTPKPTSSET